MYGHWVYYICDDLYITLFVCVLHCLFVYYIGFFCILHCFFCILHCLFVYYIFFLYITLVFLYITLFVCILHCLFVYYIVYLYITLFVCILHCLFVYYIVWVGGTRQKPVDRRLLSPLYLYLSSFAVFKETPQVWFLFYASITDWFALLICN